MFIAQNKLSAVGLVVDNNSHVFIKLASIPPNLVAPDTVINFPDVNSWSVCVTVNNLLFKV